MKEVPLTRRHAFSLIEIMVVVAIIGTLLGLVSWKVISSQTQAKVTATRARMQTVRQALEMYKMDQRKYPTSADGLKILTQVPANRSDSYLDEDQMNDAWGNPLQYQIPGKNGKAFDLVSHGDDGAPGGEKEASDLSIWDRPDAAAPAP